MILYVVTDTYELYKTKPVWFIHRNTLERIAGDACVVLHYTQLDLQTVEQINPWAICHSGSTNDVRSMMAYRRVIMETDVAQIGFCGGHQIITKFYGGELGSMRKLTPNEPDPNPAYHQGHFKEFGLCSVRIIKVDPLFRGLGRQLHVLENHYWEVKRLPPTLVLLASSRVCRVQVFRHRTKPIYGTQFHPEVEGVGRHDGGAILTNFFRIAKMHHKHLGRQTVQNTPSDRTR